VAKQKLGIFWDFTRDWDLSQLLHHENPENPDSYIPYERTFSFPTYPASCPRTNPPLSAAPTHELGSGNSYQLPPIFNQ